MAVGGGWHATRVRPASRGSSALLLQRRLCSVAVQAIGITSITRAHEDMTLTRVVPTLPHDPRPEDRIPITLLIGSLFASNNSHLKTDPVMQYRDG